MGETFSISIDALTEDEIEALSMRRLRRMIGIDIDLFGTTEPNHTEVPAGCECTFCHNGLDLDKAGKAVCLRCSRGSRAVDKAIRSVKRESAVLRADRARKTIDAIKARSIVQMRGGRARRGPTINPDRMAVVQNTIKAELAKRAT